MKENNLERMKELTALLNKASKAYFAQDEEIMSNHEYDKLYDELVRIESDTGITLSDSPTIRVGYEAVEELPKEHHDQPMLSLGKTKSREELQEWLKDKTALLSWKLDGLTIVLTYDDGKLVKAVTRGNGEIGEVITNNAKVFKNIPLSISFKGRLVLRGEAVITYSDFERINRELGSESVKYKNPRNLCSGSVRQLNSEITAKRNVRFYAFSLVEAQGEEFEGSREQQLLFLKRQGFEVVEYKKVTGGNVLEALNAFESEIDSFDIPSDGLVLVYDDIEYGRTLGSTAKFPRDSIAFKWADEMRETVLDKIEWSPSRTGLINPIAVFAPVELEGTTVSRASLHNVSIMKGLKLGLGDKITVYKANMIIPQIAENLTGSDDAPIPAECPVCGGKTELKKVNEVESLYCLNPECTAKKIKSFTLFVSRDAMNIDGLSEATLEKFIAKGFVHEFSDLFRLARFREQIIEMEGFGEKSFQNLEQSIEKARHTTLSRLIYALGIDNIGVANAKMICREFRCRLDKMKTASVEELSEIDGIGDVIATSFYEYFRNPENNICLDNLLKELTFTDEAVDEEEQTLKGKAFVVTGSLEHFASRSELKELIEAKGGKVTGSVSAKTVCLINNDNTSLSAKNKKAQELGIPILTEKEFMVEYLNK